MREDNGILTKIFKGIEVTLEILAAILLAIFCLAVMSQVITRFVFNAPLAWTEEVSKYSFIYMIFLGCTAGVRRMSHFSFNAFSKVKSEAVRKFIAAFAMVLQMVFFGFLLYTSILFIPQMHARMSPVLKMRMSIPYSCIIVFSALGLIFTIEHAIRIITGKQLKIEKEESYLID